MREIVGYEVTQNGSKKGKKGKKVERGGDYARAGSGN
jgi:hypothetical protein